MTSIKEDLANKWDQFKFNISAAFSNIKAEPRKIESYTFPALRPIFETFESSLSEEAKRSYEGICQAFKEKKFSEITIFTKNIQVIASEACRGAVAYFGSPESLSDAVLAVKYVFIPVVVYQVASFVTSFFPSFVLATAQWTATAMVAHDLFKLFRNVQQAYNAQKQTSNDRYSVLNVKITISDVISGTFLRALLESTFIMTEGVYGTAPQR